MERNVQHVFIVGAKGFIYGGYETFLDRLTEYHQDKEMIQYHIACKANGAGATDENDLPGVKRLSDTEYIYHNAHCFKIKSPEIGSAQAIFYDIKALRYCCDYIKKHHIRHPIVYVLSTRIGFSMGHYARKLHKLGGVYWNNPDGREALRRKYKAWIRRYWALSERGMIKHSDLVICDNHHIEEYILETYRRFHPRTTYIAYGSDSSPSRLSDQDPKYTGWLQKNGLRDHQYYISVGRFVPENNFETMIREFMKSKTEKDFAVITTEDDGFLNELDRKLQFRKDPRVKIVGSVYDKELIKKIRENAFGYIHGHEVGGTNPSLLEALGSTNLNLVYDIGFNRECGEDGALYWSKEDGSLSHLIDLADQMNGEDISILGQKAHERIRRYYSWQLIADEYEKVFLSLTQGEKANG
ncbi:MAG: DUF1972 domain-containing protein [Lachnospiraceae bacterium]|nr:DUF1972 domain-containing protein [Lachnospiraceae bacterium]